MTRRLFILAAVFLAAQFFARADDLAKSSVLENDVAYLRVGHVGTNLAEEIQSAQAALAATNKIIGTVLDLRFADGSESAAAKATADLFAAKKTPLAILVNGDTRDGAVELAELLKDARDGLFFGSTAGGTKSWGPVQPDIAVKVSLADERAFLENPYGTLAQSGTNSIVSTNNSLPFIDHTSEADLVRAKIKDGDEDENTPQQPDAELLRPFIRDPALARALDLIKGLAVVRQSRL